MLLNSANEIVFMPGLPARWGGEVEGDASAWLVTEDHLDTPASADIFHVWSTSLGLGPEAVLLFDRVVFPLTASAVEVRDAYDIYSNPILQSCVHKGMPTIMEQPYPMELIDEGDRIVMRMEEGDAVRVFDMSPDANMEGLETALMGNSRGHWEDGVLVVETTGSTWPYIDMTGIPSSPNTHMLERFAPNDDGNRLDYTITITNADVLTEPVTLSKFWLYVPDAVVAPYECEE